ncbi:MAG TPA: imidazole glycerol phosphate synthase cyclase subunit [Fluviicola sp.]|nr:imidazole glycerol phosphate synthase cyclase subunit [Fluviicola sp.]
MLKVRIIPILTFNGFGLVKTKQFQQPRMVGNPVQAARVYNSRGVDELLFLDIFATKQKRKLNLKMVSDVIRECFMPVGIGGGIDNIEDIRDLLKIGADKVIIKTAAINDPDFVNKAADFFGAQCISVAVDAYLDENGVYRIYTTEKGAIPVDEFIPLMSEKGAGEIVLTSVDRDGMMQGFDIDLVKLAGKSCQLPIVVAGGGGEPAHFTELFSQTDCGAAAAASIFHFTQFTPLDIKRALETIGKPVRL